MISFEVGKRYAEMTDYLTEWKVTARTKSFVTVKNNQGKTQKAKIRTVDYADHEAIALTSNGSLLHASFEVGSKSYLDFKNRVEIGNQKVANAMQEDDARFNQFVETLRDA